MFKLAGKEIESRLLLGSAQYESPEIMKKAIAASGTQVVTVSLRRQSPSKEGGKQFWNYIKELSVHVLPNTAGCRTAREAITTANMAREFFGTDWIKVEITGDDYTLESNPFELVEANRELCRQGFCVFAYTSSSLSVASRLVEDGCNIVMPWASPIGSGQGPSDLRALLTLRKRLPHITLIVDAGIGRPSDAVKVMELGYDAVLLNTAVAKAIDSENMARAFKLAVQAGRIGYEAGVMEERLSAMPSTPTVGTPFWQLANYPLRSPN